MVWGFQTCGPNEAMVVSGCCYARPYMIAGGRVFVWPGIQRVDRISLNTMTLIIESPRIYTQLGVPIIVTGVAQVKIESGTHEMLATACEQFLGKTTQEIAEVAKATLEAHQRAIMGKMTVEEIYQDRKKFSHAVFNVASSDLVSMGISVVSYTLKDIKDDESYLKSLGLARTAQVKRDARIGEAEARKESGIREAKAEQDSTSARMLNDIEIAKARRDFELKKAEFDKEVQAKKAQSDLSYSLQAAKTKQRIMEEEMEVKNIERIKAIQVQELEIQRREKSLEATVRKPADAELYRLRKLAEADKLRVVKEAEAEAEYIRLLGEAEAFSKQAKADAESQQMQQKAMALKQYGKAAKLQLVLDVLPKVAAEVANPMNNCQKITMISSGQAGLGASKLTGEILSIMEKMPVVIEKMTGVDLKNTLCVT